MASMRLKIAPWRFVVIALGVAVPLVAVGVILALLPPSPLKYDPPQARVLAVRYQEALDALKAGDLARAQAKLEALRDENALNPLVHALLGQIHRQAGRIPEAIAATRMALGLDPKLAEAHYNLACDLVRTGQKDEALAHLRQAVGAGFDVRTPAKDDPDLAPIRDDQRMQVYLEGASDIPAGDRNASFRIDPPDPRVGQPFTLVLELLALNQPAGRAAPPVSVAFRGPAESEVLAPLSVEAESAGSSRAGTMRYRWTYRYRLVARARFAGQIGPWEIQVGGVVVPIDAPVLVVGGDEGGDEVPESVPAFRTDEFFSEPKALPGAGASPARVEALPGGGGWVAGAFALSVAPLPPGGAAEVDARFESGLAPLASYDELYREPGEGAPSRLRRVYAFAPEVMPVVARAPVTVRLGASRLRLPITYARPVGGPGTDRGVNP